MARSGGQEREPQALSGWRRSATRAQAPIALGGRDDMDRPLSDEEKRILETAAHCLPGGALGSTRLPDDLAFIVKRGSGSKLYDVSGREYIDYLMGSGPLILGHAHPAVVAAVRAQLEHGTTYFLVNEPIVALADELCRAVPCAELVAVIVEPFQRLISPQPGFLPGLRTLTQRHGIPLIFDEVVTGFRFAYGGAQEYYGVVPDLAAYGKIIGGGFPLAAVCGRREIMRAFDPRLEGTPEFVAQVGTLSGNPIAAVAGLATLAELRKPGAYAQLQRIGRALRDGLAEIVRKSGLEAQVIGETAVFDVVFTDRPITDYRAMLTADGARLKAFNAECLRRGVVKGVSKIYVTLAHGDDDVARTLAAFAEAIDVVSRSAPAARA